MSDKPSEPMSVGAVVFLTILFAPIGIIAAIHRSDQVNRLEAWKKEQSGESRQEPAADPAADAKGLGIFLLIVGAFFLSIIITSGGCSG